MAQGKEIKRKEFVGETGNKATVTEEDRNPRSMEAHYAKSLLSQAGSMYAPIGSNYLGFAVVFYYAKPGLTEHDKTYFTACQTSVDKLPEEFADLGWKNLRAALMKSFGREKPVTRE